jgi:hypothetical protein
MRRCRLTPSALAALVGLGALVSGGASFAAPAQERAPAWWAGTATWTAVDIEELTATSGVKRKESRFTVSMRVTFGKAPRYAATYQVKSGAHTWNASGGTFERLVGIVETTCSWKVSRTLRLTKYAGALQFSRYPTGDRVVFAAADSLGPSARVPKTCTRKYLNGHNPPVETETFMEEIIAPNPLFPLSRKTAGFPARGRPPRVAGSDRASYTQHPASGPGSTVTYRGSSRWSWQFTARS